MSKTLLLADDSLTIQRVVDLTFAQEDVRVVSCGTGDLAVKWMEDERPDIVLADVGMPQPDGYAVAQHMKQSARLRTVPVLLLTGAFEPLDDDKARESECDGILVKPFEPQHLVARVIELLARQAVAVAVEDAPDDVESGSDGVVPDSSPASEVEASATLPPVSLHLVESPAPAPPPADEPFNLELAMKDMADLDTALEMVETAGVAEPAEPLYPVEAQPVDEPLVIEWNAPLAAAEELAGGAPAPDLPLEPLDTLEPLAELTPLPPLETEAWDLAAPPDQPPAPAPETSVRAVERAIVADGAAAGPRHGAPPVSLASAFSALLAAEQALLGVPGAAASPVLTEAAIEDIVRRVLLRVTDDMVRQVVLDAAERMIKAKIEKIKDAPDDRD